MERQPGVDSEGREVSVALRRERRAHEEVERALLLRAAPDHLIGERIEAEIAVMGSRRLIDGGIGKRLAEYIVTLIGERQAVIPEAKLVDARVFALAPSDGVLRLRHRQDAVPREADPIGVGALRVRVRVGGGLAAEHAAEHGPRAGLEAPAHAEPGKRIDRAALRKVEHVNRRPTEQRIDEHASARGDGELDVEALLAELDVELVAELLIVPELPEPRRAIALNAADCLEGADVVDGKIPAVQLHHAGVELTAVEAESGFGVDLQSHRRQAVVSGALLQSAGGIGEDLAGLGCAEGHSDLGEGRAQAVEVAKQIGAVVRRGIRHGLIRDERRQTRAADDCGHD